jgi:DNA-binding CsgD family transcriptional regulator
MRSAGTAAHRVPTLSLSAIKSHLSRIHDKLPARNRVEIAAWAWEHGVVG